MGGLFEKRLIVGGIPLIAIFADIGNYLNCPSLNTARNLIYKSIKAIPKNVKYTIPSYSDIPPLSTLYIMHVDTHSRDNIILDANTNVLNMKCVNFILVPHRD